MRHAAIGLALLVSGAGAQAADAPAPPSITVEGIGQVETMPDVATISFSIRGEGAVADAATRNLVAKQQAILGGLATLGDGRMQIRTGEVSLNEARAGDCNSDDDDKVRLSTGKCAVTGYVAQVSVTVRMGSVKDAGTAVGLAARLGASNARMSGFDLLQPGDAKRRAAAAAIADARTKAEAIAAASGDRLGPIQKVIDSEAMGGIGDEIVVTGTRNNLRRLPPPPVAVDIRPEPVKTTARFSVTFAIQR